MTPKRPTLPEGTDPVEALRQLQRALANPRRMVFSGSAATEDVEYDRGATEAERAAGMNLAPIVGAVEALVATLRQQAQELDPFAVPSWYGSVWACPVAECEWTHREENAVSSTDAEAAERVRGSLVDHFLSEHGPHSLAHALVTRMLDWPAHCSEWIAGSDPENPDQCPEYASPGSDKCALHDPRTVDWMAEEMRRRGWRSPTDTWPRPRTVEDALGMVPTPQEGDHMQVADQVFTYTEGQWKLAAESPGLTGCPGFKSDGTGFHLQARCVHCGHPANYHAYVLQAVRGPITYPEPRLSTEPAKPLRARVAYPPPNTEWRHGFGAKNAATMWRCQRCGTNHEGNPPGCLHCGHTVLDPGHWIALPPR